MQHSKKTIEKLAKEFAAIIRRDLDSDELSEVLDRNKENPDNCATHDFLDANMSMDEAFKNVLGRGFIFFDDEKPETEQQNEEDTYAWNEAWSLAKKNQFFIK